jgi:energy-coupling factor transporter ATP-binding protein EcfA2
MIAESIEKLSQAQSSDNPFPGLRPFELHESHLFFGREGQSEKMLKKLEATRFLAVVGTSGSGKSSLVRAGLVPSLLGGMMVSAGSNWRVAVMRPSNDPIGNLAGALSSREVFGSDVKENAEIQTQVAEATLRRGNLGLVEAVRLALQTADENLLVVVDQFEELFRFAREAKSTRYENDAAAFVKLLLEPSRQYQSEQEELNRRLRAIEGELRQKKLTQEEARRQSAAARTEARKRDVRIYVVLTMRSDFLGDCAKFWDLPEAINESQYLIPRLMRDQLREAIAGPVAVGKGEIAPRLVNQLLNDIGDNQDQLPVLQHALMRTWDEWKQRNHDHRAPLDEIDLCCYEAIGGMKEALSRHADEAYRELDQRQHKIAERMFKALTERGEDNREIRRPVTLAVLASVVGASEDEVKAVIEKFRQPGRSFLMPPAEMPLHSDTLIDISHESLIRVWEKLRAWVNEEAESAAIYRRLAVTAALHGKGEANLLGKLDLRPVVRWRKKSEPNPHWANRYESDLRYATDLAAALAFIEASRKNRAAEIADRRHIRQEKAKAASRLRRLLAALVVIALLAGIAALSAFTLYRKADAETQRASQLADEAQRAKNEAIKQRAYAIMGEEDAKKAAAEAERQKTIAEGAAAEAEKQRGLAEAQALIAQQQTQAANKATTEAKKQQELAESTAYVASMNLARSEFDNGNLARGFELIDAYLPQENLRSFYWYYLWRQNHHELATLKGHGACVSAVAFAPDGRTLASGSADNTVKLWRGATDEQVARQRNK